MKKLMSAVLVGAMVLSLVGCGGISGEKGGSEKFTMTIGHSQPESNPRSISLEQFKKDVEEKTDGRVVVEVIGNGALGTEKEMLEQVVGGQIQGMRGGQYDFSPRLLMFTLPFIASNREEVTALLQSDLAKKVSMEAEAETGTVIINLCDAGGFRNYSNNVKVLKTPEDFVGLKMRSNGMKTIDLAIEALGANVVSVPYSELYQGLSTGLADGQENPWVNVEGMKFYEVQKYFSEVRYQFHPDPFYVNADWWNKLPQDLQGIITDCATDMGNYNDELIDELDSKAKQVVIDYGCEVYVPTADEIDLFKEAMEPAYQRAVEEGILSQEELEEILSIVQSVK